MSISKIRESAREALTGKWGKGALITLAYFAIVFIIGFIQGLFEENSVMSNLLGIITVVIEVPISLGLIYAFIKLKRGEDVKAFDFLEMGFSNFGRAWKISLRTLLKLILPIIIIVLIIELAMLITFITVTKSEQVIYLTAIGFGLILTYFITKQIERKRKKNIGTGLKIFLFFAMIPITVIIQGILLVMIFIIGMRGK